MSLKISWLQILINDQYLQQFTYKKLCNIIKDTIWRCNLNKKDTVQLFGNSFWSQVLQAWSAINFVDTVNTEQEFANQILWYNSLIRRQGKPFLIEKAYKKGLYLVKQLVSIEGGLIPCEIATEMYKLTVMEYNTIITALPKAWRKTYCLKGQITYESFLYDTVIGRAKVSSYAYKKLNNQPQIIENVLIKFNVTGKLEVDFDNYSEALLNIKILTKNAKLQSFQFRFLHSRSSTLIFSYADGKS